MGLVGLGTEIKSKIPSNLSISAKHRMSGGIMR